MHFSRSSLPCAGIVLALASTVLPATAMAQAASSFERPPVLNAADVLPPKIAAGPNHTVRAEVGSDGFLNIYDIDSRWGTLRAVSDAQLQQYVSELDAVARLTEVRSSKEFVSGAKGVASDTVKGATGLLMHPVGSISGAVSGVGSLFGRAGEALTDPGAKGAGEDGKLANLLGYSKTKRELAYEFGVDVYSRDPILQKELDATARAAFAGSITAKAALMAVPGAAGMAVSVTRNTNSLDEVFRDLPPLELRKRNRAKLEAIAVNPDVIDLYIGNAVLTPREQTLIVEALFSMGGTENRGALIKHAINTDNADLAQFRVRQAQMYAAYSAAGPTLARFVTVGETAVGQSADGTIVFCAPLDTLYWTEHLAAFVEVFDRHAAGVPGAKGKLLVLGGGVSPLARKELEARGWAVKAGG